jgi:hypothetical protein
MGCSETPRLRDSTGTGSVTDTGTRMANDDQFINELRRLYEAESETQRALDSLACGGPGGPVLFMAARGQTTLTVEPQAHVDECPVCRRWCELARKTPSTGGAIAGPSHAELSRGELSLAGHSAAGLTRAGLPQGGRCLE